MRSESVYKVPKGKLLKIRLEYDEHTKVIREIRIMGDFFMYPEEAVELFEHALRGIVLERECVLEKIRQVVQDNDIQFIGVDVEGLTTGIVMCRK
ncbi:MAG: lipoate protein ligase C-terminal domain-containing protein [Methanobacteriota archaeon]